MYDHNEFYSIATENGNLRTPRIDDLSMDQMHMPTKLFYYEASARPLRSNETFEAHREDIPMGEVAGVSFRVYMSRLGNSRVSASFDVFVMPDGTILGHQVTRLSKHVGNDYHEYSLSTAQAEKVQADFLEHMPTFIAANMPFIAASVRKVRNQWAARLHHQEEFFLKAAQNLENHSAMLQAMAQEFEAEDRWDDLLAAAPEMPAP